MKKFIKYEVTDDYYTLDARKLDLKDNEHYLYKHVYVDEKKRFGFMNMIESQFVEVVDDNWLKHHKTYYNCDVIDNTEKTTKKYGYYDINYQFRVDLYGKQFKGKKLSTKQLKNPSYEV